MVYQHPGATHNKQCKAKMGAAGASPSCFLFLVSCFLSLVSL
jgi:hypothetical protein